MIYCNSDMREIANLFKVGDQMETKVAILTSGGDSPGMNPCLRACVRLGIYNGFEMFGVHRGYQGLIDGDIEKMNSRSVSDIIQRGGTFLKTARCEEFTTKEGRAKAYENLKKLGIKELIVIGGDGSFRGARDFSDEYDINVTGIPGTIDNDLAYTDYTLGFDTAVNTVLWAINSLRDTMGSHDRCALLEVMGRKCGDIALYAGLCGGAEYILTPEIPFDLDEIAKGLIESRKKGKTSNMIIFAEGAGDKDEICRILKEKTGVKITQTVLGHIQRGGSPTMFDRMLAARMAQRAIELLKVKTKARVIGIIDNKITDMNISEALEMPRRVDKKLYEVARVLGL